MVALQILRQHYDRKQKQGYSMRALARDLDVSPTFISNIFNGKKKIPLTMLTSLARHLDIASDALMDIRRELIPDDPFPWAGLNSRQNSVLQRWAVVDAKGVSSATQQWFFLAIMDVTCCRSYDGTTAYIARRLGLPEEVVTEAVRGLVEAGLLVERDGLKRKAKDHIRVDSADLKPQIRKFHRQMFQRASLELDDVTEEAFARRQIIGISFNISPDKISVAKKMLSDALHEIVTTLGGKDGDEVYYLASQLFPLTKSE